MCLLVIYTRADSASLSHSKGTHPPVQQHSLQKHYLWNKISFSCGWKRGLGSAAELIYLRYFSFYWDWKSWEGWTCSSDTLQGGKKRNSFCK